MIVRLPWRRPLSPVLAGTFAVFALLPRVSLTRTMLFAVGTLTAASLPVAITLITGQFIGTIPDALTGGIDSAAGHALIRLLITASALIVLLYALRPIQEALASTFARQVDRHLQERVMAAVGRPRGIAHLEDPITLDLIRNAQGV